jgi:hypothetical protein
MSFTDALFALMPMQALAAALVLIVLVGWRGANAGGRWAQVGLVALAPRQPKRTISTSAAASACMGISANRASVKLIS